MRADLDDLEDRRRRKSMAWGTPYGMGYPLASRESGVMLTKANISAALDRLLLERFAGKVTRGDWPQWMAA